eukprot:gene13718-4011_t
MTEMYLPSSGHNREIVSLKKPYWAVGDTEEATNTPGSKPESKPETLEVEPRWLSSSDWDVGKL